MSTSNGLHMALGLTPARSNGKQSDDGSWFEAMAEAWGQALDRQANKISEMSTEIGEGGNESPAMITQLTAESLRMQYISNSSHTALSSMGSALETMARKQ